MPDQDTQVDHAAEAAKLGWVPQDKFRGDAAHWVDAETFVRRGHEVMPLLKATNSRLQAEVTAMGTALAEAKAAIEDLKVSSATMVKDRVAAAKADLMASLKQAKTDNDVDAELALTDQLVEIRAAEKAAKEEPPPPAAPAVDPAFTVWTARPENAWWSVDRRRTSLAMAIGQELRSDPANHGLTGIAFYEKVGAEVEATLNPRAAPADRVEGSRGGSNGSGAGGGKGFSALPADARAACDEQAKRFVGKPGFKTQADYRTYYANLYFAGSES